MSEPERIPAEVFPLAEFLYEEMKARGWRTQDVAIRMAGKTAYEMSMDLLCLDLLMCVHEDGLLVGDKMFAKLATAFEVSEDFFRNLDAAWRGNPSQRRAFTCPDDIFGPVSRRALIHAV